MLPGRRKPTSVSLNFSANSTASEDGAPTAAMNGMAATIAFYPGGPSEGKCFSSYPLSQNGVVSKARIGDRTAQNGVGSWIKQQFSRVGAVP